MLLLNSHLLLLLLYCQSQVVRAYSSNGAENCLPRCCSQGQILDPSGTACLKNPATQILPDPCGRRDSFLPQCELENNEEDEGKKGKKIFFLFKQKTFFDKTILLSLLMFIQPLCMLIAVCKLQYFLQHLGPWDIHYTLRYIVVASILKTREL